MFICSKNKHRSPTAEAIFSDHPKIEVDSAGLSDDAVVLLSAEQVEWADLIFVMETVHRESLNRKFRAYLGGKRVVVLNIRDEFEFMDAGLIKLLRARCESYFS